MARLGDICTVVSGTTPKSTQAEYWDGDLNWVTPAELTDESDIIYDSQRKITQQAVIDSSLKSFPAGTVLLSSRAPIGKVAIAGTEMYCNQGFKNLICSDKIYNRYLYHFLKDKTDYLNSLGRGATFKEISKSIVENIEIPLPPLEEQRKIAAVLDKVSDLIAKRRTQLDKLDELVKSRFVEMFGDPVDDSCRYQKTPLGAIANVGSSKRIFEKEYVNEGVPFYRTKEIVELSKGHKITTELFITKERYDEICKEYGAPQKGDLLISAVGTIGIIWIVDGKNNFYFKDGNLLRVSVSNNFNPIYLKMLLETLISAQKQKISAGTAYAALTISMLKEMMVYIVPMDEQNQFADFVKQTDKSKYFGMNGIKLLWKLNDIFLGAICE